MRADVSPIEEPVDVALFGSYRCGPSAGPSRLGGGFYPTAANEGEDQESQRDERQTADHRGQDVRTGEGQA